jgi:hypothetical protein
MISASQGQQEESSSAHIRHIVCLKFKPEITTESILEVEKKFPALQLSIPGIISIEWGLNNSPEGLNKGFSHCFIVTFENETARSTYLPHPAHQAFVEILKPLLDDVFVIDYNL